MDYLKKYGKTAIIIGGIVLLYISLLAVTHNLGILKLSSIGKINFVVMAISLFLGGFMRGKKASKKGYLEGLKLGGIVVGVLFIINILCYRHVDLYVFLYYIVLIVSSIIGSMIGINLRR